MQEFISELKIQKARHNMMLRHTEWPASRQGQCKASGPPLCSSLGSVIRVGKGCLPLFLFQASHLARPLKSKIPGRSAKKSYERRNDLRTSVAVTHIALLEKTIKLKELCVTGLLGKLVGPLSSRVEFSLCTRSHPRRPLTLSDIC